MQIPSEFCFLFLHILNGRMATLLRALPQSFRDLHFCFRESKFKTAASASFRGVDFFYDFLEVLPRSHGELPRKLFGGVAWKCAGGLSVPPRENFASAKLPRSFRKEYEHFYQNHTKIIATLCLPQLNKSKNKFHQFWESTSGTITKDIAIHL